jgi:biotin-dependent carboxylase-like uncharacterized protein
MSTQVRALEILETGPLCTVQDLGRPGLGAIGVGVSGAADTPACRLANRLVGNDEGAAVLEVTLGGLRARAHGDVLIALSGAPCRVRADAPGAGMWTPFRLAEGHEIGLDPPETGLRTYLAVRGGLDVAPVLGSRATDVLAGLGPPVPTSGDRLPVGRAVGTAPGVDLAPQKPLADEPVLRVLPGPRDDWFASSALERLTTSSYHVTSDANRVGVRLDGPALERRRGGELPSEGMAIGSLQVPPDGRPVLFLADHPVTGGYPVLAVVASADLPAAAQLRPGQDVRFVSDFA